MAAQLGCRLREMKFPTPARTEQFARDVWSETVRLSARAILDTAVGEHVREDKLIHAVCAGEGRLGLARLSITPSVPVVAAGGPVSVYYGEVARRLGCEVVFPDYGDVANAVGAATGVVAQTVTVRVDGSGLFMLYSTVGTRQFTDPAAALAAATTPARESARDAVIAWVRRTRRSKSASANNCCRTSSATTACWKRWWLPRPSVVRTRPPELRKSGRKTSLST